MSSFMPKVWKSKNFQNTNSYYNQLCKHLSKNLIQI